MDAFLDIVFLIVHEIIYVSTGKWIFGPKFALRSGRQAVPIAKRFALGLACSTATLGFVVGAVYVGIQFGALAP